VLRGPGLEAPAYAVAEGRAKAFLADAAAGVELLPVGLDGEPANGLLGQERLGAAEARRAMTDPAADARALEAAAKAWG